MLLLRPRAASGVRVLVRRHTDTHKPSVLSQAEAALRCAMIPQLCILHTHKNLLLISCVTCSMSSMFNPLASLAAVNPPLFQATPSRPCTSAFP